MLAMYHIVNPKAQFCLIAQYKKRQGKMETIILYNLALTLKTWVNVIQHYLHCMDFGLLVCHFRVQWTLQEETVTMFEETCGGIKSDLWFEFATFVFVNTECCQKQHLSTKSYWLTQHLVFSLSDSHRTLRSSLGISLTPRFRRRQNREWTGSWVWMGHTQGWGPCSGWTYEPVSGLWHG